MHDYEQLCRDLVAEEDDLDIIIAKLDDADWSTPTPADGVGGA
jgi:hypothetical protein